MNDNALKMSETERKINATLLNDIVLGKRGYIKKERNANATLRPHEVG